MLGNLLAPSVSKLEKAAAEAEAAATAAAAFVDEVLRQAEETDVAPASVTEAVAARELAAARARGATRRLAEAVAASEAKQRASEIARLRAIVDTENATCKAARAATLDSFALACAHWGRCNRAAGRGKRAATELDRSYGEKVLSEPELSHWTVDETVPSLTEAADPGAERWAREELHLGHLTAMKQ